MRRVRLFLTSVLIVAGLVACCCTPNFQGQVNKGGGPGQGQAVNQNPQINPAAGDPAEQAAIGVVKANGGFVKEEGGHVVEVTMFQPSVTDDTLKDLSSLTRTRKMKVTNSKVTGPGLKHLAGLKELTELDLWGSPINDEGAKAIGSLTQLKVLNISGSKISGPAFRDLAPLIQLEDLSASGMGLSDTGVMNIAQNLKQLKRLAVDNNSEFNDISVAAIASLPNLRALIINGVRFTDVGLSSLTKRNTLEELQLSFHQTDNSAKILANCKSLRILRLFNTQITDKGLQDIGTLPKLTELELRGNKGIPGAAVAAFIKTHPNCNVKQGN